MIQRSRNGFAMRFRKALVGLLSLITVSAIGIPMAGAGTAGVTISNPISSTVYGPTTWNPTISGTATDGVDTLDYVQVLIFDATNTTYWDGVNEVWTSVSTLNDVNGSYNWSFTMPASKLPVGDALSVFARSVDLSSNTLDSSTIPFTYQVPNGSFLCNSNPNLFNTGYNVNNGGVLPNGKPDTYWQVAGPVPTAGASDAPSGLTWTSASVNKLTTAWATTPFINSQWISQQDLTQPAQDPSGLLPPGDWWYRFKFDLTAADPSGFQVPMNWMADNNIYEIYVNGVAQSPTTVGLPQDSNPLNEYSAIGFTLANASHAVLHGFVAGTNTITVQIKSDNDNPSFEGFNAVFRPSSVCPVDLSVTKTASPSPYNPGKALTYTVTVHNAGPATAYNVNVVDNLPAELPVTGPNAFTWSCASSAVTSRCISSGPATGSGSLNETIFKIAPGDSIIYTVTGTVPLGTSADLTNTATVTPAADSPDPLCSPNCHDTNVDHVAKSTLSILKTESPDPYIPGQTLTYTVTVSNSGPDAVTGATVSDVLPAALSTFTWTCHGTGGGTCAASGSGNIADTVNVPNGGTVVYSITGTVPHGTTGAILNSATVTSPNSVVDTNCTGGCESHVSVSDNPTLDLSVTKTASLLEFVPGQPLTYTVTVANASSAYDAIGAKVADNLPAALQGAGFTWTCAAASGSSCTASGSGNISDTVNVAINSSVVYTVTGTVPSSVESAFGNTATITPPSGFADPGCSPSCSDTVTLNPHVVLDIVPTKSASPNPFVPGQTLTYTVTVTNNGPSDAFGVGVSDPIPTGLPTSGIGAFTWTCLATVGASCAASGSGSITDNVDIPSGGDVTYTLTGTVPSSHATDLVNRVTATTPSGTFDTNCNTTCFKEITTPSAPKTDLSILKSASPNPYVPGRALTYTITVSNAGPSDNSGAVITDTLPAALQSHGFTWTCVASGAGSCGAASGSGDVSDTADVVAGGTVTYTITGTVPSSTTGSIANTARVVSSPDATDTNCSVHCDSLVTTPPAPVTHLSITKTASPSIYVPGDTLTYTVSVSNVGPSDASGATVSDTLPTPLQSAGFTWTCAPSAGSDCTPSGSGDITDTVDVVSGGNIVYTISGTVPLGTSATLSNTASATPPTGTTDAFCVSVCSATVSNVVARDSITIQTIATPQETNPSSPNVRSRTGHATQGSSTNSSLTLGGKIKYTYVVKNTGNRPLTSVTVHSPLTPVIQCPKTTLAPGETMTCVTVGLYTVTESDVTAHVVINHATATGINPNAQSVSASSLLVNTPVVDVKTYLIGTDLGSPDGLRHQSRSGLLVGGAIALLMAGGLVLGLRRRGRSL